MSWARGVPGIVGVANLVLLALLMGGARMNCATHHGWRPGFQGSLCHASWVVLHLMGGALSCGRRHEL